MEWVVFRTNTKKYTRKGGGSLVTKSKLQKELMAKIDKTSEIQKEKVERYVSFWELYSSLYKNVKKMPMIVVKNGAQEYVKTNPAVSELNKINNSMIALGKDMGLDAPEELAKAATSDMRGDLL